MPYRHLNLRELESRLNQLVIDLHDAARLTEHLDAGVANALRQLAHDLNDVVRGMRRLLVSDVDSQWGQ